MDITQLEWTWIGWPNGEKLVLTWCKFECNQSDRKSSQANANAPKAGLNVNNQLVTYATRFLAVRLKNHVW